MMLFTTDIQKYTIDIDDDVSDGDNDDSTSDVDDDASSNDFNYYYNDDYGADDQLNLVMIMIITDYSHVVKFSSILN
jgi:hypothetical protein